MVSNNNACGTGRGDETSTLDDLPMEVLPASTVLIAGGGPVGLTLATVLAFYGVKTVVLERNATTTHWPKMDLTNVRSMELFRKLGLSDELRKQGVPSHLPYSVLMSTGLGGNAPVAEWQHGTVDEYRCRIAANNDGSMPLEPWQRLSQAIFERWLKGLCDQNPLIDVRFSHKVDSVEDLGDGVLLTVTNVTSGSQGRISSRYLIGCDGGSSRVRRDLGIPLDGGPMPVYVLLVHFKSQDLTRLHAQGRFWHIFCLGETGLNSSVISQNEKDVWTTHLLLPMDQDSSEIASEDAIYRALGGQNGPYEIKIDEILVRSTYRPNIAIAQRYSGFGGHVFLAGDAAHQNIPTGGYGMNMGIADAFELGWKLAGVVNGYLNSHVLDSYEAERRPTALLSIERSGVHMAVHMDAIKLVQGKFSEVDSNTEEGARLRRTLQDYYEAHNGENTDLGIEMGYRYTSNIITTDRGEAEAPNWDPSTYKPTTYPGCRAPHVFLRNGRSIIDEFGTFYTLVEFCDGTDRNAKHLIEAAWRARLPVKHVRLFDEHNARRVYQQSLVLVRPDGHVAWRSDQALSTHDAQDVIHTVSGGTRVAVPTKERNSNESTAADSANVGVTAFTSTVGLQTQSSQFKLEKMGEFQS